jgi:hypothetical protein
VGVVFASSRSVVLRYVVRVLLDAGTPVDIADDAGSTPLRSAIQASRYAIPRASNIKLDDYSYNLRAIPDWVTVFVESRSNCRTSAIVMVGIHKYHRTAVTGNNDINVLRLIGKHIWSMRMNDIWAK